MPVFRTHEGSFVIIRRETTDPSETTSPIGTPYTSVSTPGSHHTPMGKESRGSNPRTILYQNPSENRV